MRKKNGNGRNKWLILGIVLILSSGLAFAMMLIIPFLPLGNRARMIGSAASFIAMEALFWTGSLLTGKELISKYKDRLNPRNWLRKKGNRQRVQEDPSRWK